VSLHFEAPAAHGTLRLSLPGPAGDPVDAALALAAHEPLLAALEAWLHEALDPAPVPRLDTAEPLLWLDAGPVRLGLPWPLLLASPGLPAPDDTALHVPWPAVAFEVELAGFDTAPLPAGASGGVLLLPNSLQGAWRVLLRHDTLVADAEWPGPGKPLALCGPPELPTAQTPPRPLWRVVLAEPWCVPLPQLLGWQPMLAPPRPGDAAVLQPPDGPPRRGRIVPALAGFGLWIDD
jgi:hypothetical protein